MRLITSVRLIKRFSVYRLPFRYIGKHVNASVNVTAWKASYVATTCTSIFGLPASVRGFLFVPMWEMRMNRILRCFGDKRVRS